jgi:hypothetical protein
VDWSKSGTTKGLRRIQMKEKRVRENIAKHFVAIHHVSGMVNLADLFTKEMKDTSHFVELCDLKMCQCHLRCGNPRPHPSKIQRQQCLEDAGLQSARCL